MRFVIGVTAVWDNSWSGKQQFVFDTVYVLVWFCNLRQQEQHLLGCHGDGVVVII